MAPERATERGAHLKARLLNMVNGIVVISTMLIYIIYDIYNIIYIYMRRFPCIQGLSIYIQVSRFSAYYWFRLEIRLGFK